MTENQSRRDNNSNRIKYIKQKSRYCMSTFECARTHKNKNRTLKTKKNGKNAQFFFSFQFLIKPEFYAENHKIN